MSTAGWLDRFTGADPKNAETDDTSLTFRVELVLLVDLVLFVREVDLVLLLVDDLVVD